MRYSSRNIIRKVAAGMVTLNLGLVSQTAIAQTDNISSVPDISPLLLIETGPSDNTDYRRMVFVKYLSSDGVTAAYKAYNRSEFVRIEDATPPALISACLNGPATTLEEIEAFQETEAVAVQEQADATIAHFCIKNIDDWEAGNRATYLDPIFDGMPYAARLNN